MTTNPARRRHLAHIHAAAQAIGLKPDSQDYRDWIKQRTKVTSCADLSDEALAAFSDSLKGTHEQWLLVGQLIREIGFTGFEDVGFRTFVKRITKVDDPRLLSKPQLRNLIAALSNWNKNRRRKAAAKATPSAD